MALMIVGMLLFWGLIIAGIVALIRYTGGGASSGLASGSATPQQVLAERFARGEIDEEEYTQRRRVLETAGQRGR